MATPDDQRNDENTAVSLRIVATDPDETITYKPNCAPGLTFIDNADNGIEDGFGGNFGFRPFPLIQMDD